MANFYVYAYLDPTKKCDHIEFEYEPFYIGRGKNSRYKQHLQANHLKDSSIKSNKILKLLNQNIDPIIIFLKTNITQEESNIEEMKYIKMFGRINNKTGILANMTDGGEGTKNVILSEETKKKMSEKAKGTKTYSNNGMSKLVGKYDLENNLLAIFNSLREASESMNVDFKNISSCARGKSKSAYGFIWKYLGKSYKHHPVIKVSNNRNKIVLQYDLNDNFIKEWNSISLAEKTLNINHISCTCLGKQKTCAGFKWKFKY